MRIISKLVSVVLLSAVAVSPLAVTGYADDNAINYGFSDDSAFVTVDGEKVSYIESEYYKVYADKFGEHFVKLADKSDGTKILPEFKDDLSKAENAYITVVFNSYTDDVKKQYEKLTVAECNTVPVAMLKINSADLDIILADENVRAVFPSFASATDDGKARVTADEFRFNYSPSVADARKILRYVAKLDSAPELLSDGKKFFVLSDTDLDMKITAKDARTSLRIAAKLETGKKYERNYNALSFWNDRFYFE